MLLNANAMYKSRETLITVNCSSLTCLHKHSCSIEPSCSNDTHCSSLIKETLWPHMFRLMLGAANEAAAFALAVAVAEVGG